jgi:hypothetical protein
MQPGWNSPGCPSAPRTSPSPRVNRPDLLSVERRRSSSRCTRLDSCRRRAARRYVRSTSSRFVTHCRDLSAKTPQNRRRKNSSTTQRNPQARRVRTTQTICPLRFAPIASSRERRLQMPVNLTHSRCTFIARVLSKLDPSVRGRRAPIHGGRIDGSGRTRRRPRELSYCFTRVTDCLGTNFFKRQPAVLR